MANKFLPFCDGPNPNVLSTAEWSANDSRSTGFKSGIAKSIDINTSIVSGANIANAVAEFIALNLPSEDVIPTAATKLIEQYISALKTYIAANGALPIGALLPYVGTTVPKGYLICNGASLLRSDYPDLFNVIGTRFGAVDSAHFKIPSLHHQFIEATTTLSEVGTYVSAGLPNIPGVIRGIQGVVDPAADGSFSIAPGAIENNIAGSNDQYIETAFSVIFSASNGNSTYGASDTVQPSSLRALVLIRSY
ncbi:phage tail protein [uncultured Parasutterella sp.]|uniref:phage tail protein n=1 Tax=uncultured Parasutterella sp. TaxID=1263098 RepID=UPI0027294F82|nr:phage tail protein [uncultured Parasutterella sp.]